MGHGAWKACFIAIASVPWTEPGQKWTALFFRSATPNDTLR